MSRMVDSLAAGYQPLYRRIGYDFQRVSLLRQALTHRSYSKVNNERLEFLGDALLGLIIAELLYQRFPQADEGQLSRCRSRLVKGETLSRLAEEQLALPSYILLGKSEKKIAQRSTLANATEALIGAIYLDAHYNINKVKAVVQRLYQRQLAELDITTLEKDPKSRLQEFCQARQVALPGYTLLQEEGKAHHKTFTVRCTTTLTEQSCTSRENSIKQAEQKAAGDMLQLLLQSVDLAQSKPGK